MLAEFKTKAVEFHISKSEEHLPAASLVDASLLIV
jgi:hypothetical protein